MSFRRYYGTVVTMLKAFDGYPFIIGGTENSAQDTGGLGVREWERLKPQTGSPVVVCTTGSSCNLPMGTSPTYPALPAPMWLTDAPLTDPGDPTEFEYYPRIHQLANSTGDFFIAGDTHPGLVNTGGGTSNDVGEMWFLRPPLTGSYAGDLVSASTVHSSFIDTDVPGGTAMNRYYGSSVLLHQLPENGGPNRVLAFGGADGCIKIPADPTYCNGTVTVRSSVKELNYIPGALPGGASTLVTKADMKCARVFSNAVILPTGEIFISRGSDTNPHSTSSPADDYVPQAWGEIYDPGPTKLSGSGSTQWTAAVPNEFSNFASTCKPNWTIDPLLNKRPPRVYHHVALLLQSGRVLVAGGDEVCGLNGSSSYSLEIYEPPYFSKGFTTELTSAPATGVFRGTIQVGFKLTPVNPLIVEIDRVVFIRTGSVTHHQDYSQVYVEAGFSVWSETFMGQTKVGILQVTVPGPSLMPPGYYHLFVVGNNGQHRVPSASKLIKID